MNKDILVKALIAQDDSRARSQQTAIGVSQLGGCRRQVWHKLQGDVGTNSTKRLAAIMGTAIHAAIESAVDNSEGRYLIEHRVEIDDLPPATIDLFDTWEHRVVDYKTTALKNLAYFPSQQQRWQVQTYGYLMTQAGYEVKEVSLIGIPRDGSENDIVVHTEPFDRNIALEALEWLKDVESRTEAPTPEREGKFCQDYCPFYGDLCQGKSKDLAGEVITDATVAKAAKDYVDINAKLKELELAKDAAKAALEGHSGVTFDGVKVSWSEVAGRATPDTDAIKAVMGSVPVKVGMPSVRLTVK